MRSRFRSEQGPRGKREGRPLELVRVRGTQRDSGPEGRDLARRRRRGGRRRSRGPGPPESQRGGFSLWRWLQGLFARPRREAEAHDVPGAASEQESRVLAQFCRHYAITFDRPELLKLALTHRSYLSVTGRGPRESNERLEFLGDSVLGLVTSEHLYKKHPGEHEGQLTKTKSLLVSKAILSRRALAMGLGRFVLMSHSEVESGGRQRLSILADAFESVIGAVYLDQGFEAARAFIERWLLRDAGEIVADKRHTNYKSHLQEFVQSTYRTHPVYRIRSEMGPDHSKHFMVEVLVGRRALGEGKGRNKKEAEQAAARDALDNVGDGRRDRPERAREQTVREQPVREQPAREQMVREQPAREQMVREQTMPASDVAPTPDTPDASEGDGLRSRRRRGRRGGRGRRARAESTVSGAVPAGVLPAPPPSEGRPRTPFASAPVIEPSEVEPLPSAHEEDEFEEVGRPEGPLEERHVDPFAIEAGTAAAETEAMPAQDEAEEPGAAADEDVMQDAPEESEGDDDTPWLDIPAEEPESRLPPAEPPAGPGRTGPSLYGRRPGRLKRGSR